LLTAFFFFTWPQPDACCSFPLKPYPYNFVFSPCKLVRNGKMRRKNVDIWGRRSKWQKWIEGCGEGYSNKISMEFFFVCYWVGVGCIVMIELIFLGGIHESLGDFVNNRCNLSGFRLCFIYFFLGKYTFDPYSHSKKKLYFILIIWDSFTFSQLKSKTSRSEPNLRHRDIKIEETLAIIEQLTNKQTTPALRLVIHTNR